MKQTAIAYMTKIEKDSLIEIMKQEAEIMKLEAEVRRLTLIARTEE